MYILLTFLFPRTTDYTVHNSIIQHVRCRLQRFRTFKAGNLYYYLDRNTHLTIFTVVKTHFSLRDGGKSLSMTPNVLYKAYIHDTHLT